MGHRTRDSGLVSVRCLVAGKEHNHHAYVNGRPAMAADPDFFEGASSRGVDHFWATNAVTAESCSSPVHWAMPWSDGGAARLVCEIAETCETCEISRTCLASRSTVRVRPTPPSCGCSVSTARPLATSSERAMSRRLAGMCRPRLDEHGQNSVRRRPDPDAPGRPAEESPKAPRRQSRPCQPNQGERNDNYDGPLVSLPSAFQLSGRS